MKSLDELSREAMIEWLEKGIKDSIISEDKIIWFSFDNRDSYKLKIAIEELEGAGFRFDKDDHYINMVMIGVHVQ